MNNFIEIINTNFVENLGEDGEVFSEKGEMYCYKNEIVKTKSLKFIKENNNINNEYSSKIWEYVNDISTVNILICNKDNIRSNIKKCGKDLKPPIIVRDYKGSEHFFEIEIKGPCKIMYRPHNPLSCGARLWIETTEEVEGKTEMQ